MSIHRTLRKPAPPGPWVDDERCECGEKYDDFNSGVRFTDAVTLVRSNNDGSWYPSRGPVLWAMRTMKLELWYWRHAGCGETDE